MYRRNRRGNPLVVIVVLFALMFAVGPFFLNLLETFVPLLLLLAVVVIISRVAFGGDFNASLQRMFSGFFGTQDWQSRQRPQYGSEKPFGATPQSNRYTAADIALSRAGNTPYDNPSVQLTDIGLLVYESASEPKICRSSDVPTDATHIRPFIVLDIPRLPDAGSDGVIRFNLVDATGKLRYTSRGKYAVKRGPNFITPKTWLPLVDQQMDGSWSLQLCIGDGDPFAIHEFRWLQIGGQVRAHFNGDGEIDELMQPAIDQGAENPVSLDELLDDQSNEASMVMNARR